MMLERRSPGKGPTLEVKGLKRAYNGVPVLKGVNLDVESGELFTVMGPSGSGKSVLLRHLIGLEWPDDGDILLDGRSIHTAGVRDQYRMAMVFQSGALLQSLTVGENVGLYLIEHRLKKPAEIQRIIAEKLEMVGLKGSEDRKVDQLSGGMRKRVAIARALAVDPQVMIYDEPTSELDPLTAVNMAREMVELNKKMHATTLVVTHDRELALGISNRIALMQEGRIHATGTPEEIQASTDPVVKRFLSAHYQALTQV